MGSVRHPGVDLPEQPVVVVALEGWIDAGFAAQSAVAALLELVESEPLVTFGAAELLDQRARRPRLRIDDGVRGGLNWQDPVLRVGVDRLGSGVAFLVGPEPDYHWKSFAGGVGDLLISMKARLVVCLGGFPAATPHTRPMRLAATASDPALVHKIGFVPGSIDVPAGIAEV